MNKFECSKNSLRLIIFLFIWFPTLLFAEEKVHKKESLKENEIHPSKNDLILGSLPIQLFPLEKIKTDFIREIDGVNTCTPGESIGFVYDETSAHRWIIRQGAGGEGWFELVCSVIKKDDVITITYSSYDDVLCKNSEMKKLSIRNDKNKKFIYHIEPPIFKAAVWLDAKGIASVKTVVTKRPCEGP